MTDTDRLAAIEARANAATDGPWRAEPWTDHLGTRDVISGGHGNYEIERLSIMQRVDAEFIAHARADVPWMADQIQRLRRWKAEALPALSGLQDLGKALRLPIGAIITAEEAAEAAKRLTARAEAAEADARALTADRDSARDWAVRLEQELAAAEATVQRVRELAEAGIADDYRNAGWNALDRIIRALDGDGSPTEGGE